MDYCLQSLLQKRTLPKTFLEGWFGRLEVHQPPIACQVSSTPFDQACEAIQLMSEIDESWRGRLVVERPQSLLMESLELLDGNVYDVEGRKEIRAYEISKDA